MTYLGSVSGTGRLIVKGQEPAEISYEIHGYRPKRLPTFNGFINGDPVAIGKAFNAGSAILILEDGFEAPILVTRMGNGPFSIQVNANVPGIE